MRILLVGIYDTNTVSLAPRILTAVARSMEPTHGHDVSSVEYSLFSDSVESMTASILEKQPDVVGFSCYIWNHELVMRIAEQLPGCTVIVGGPQVTGVEQDILRDNPAVDIVVTGEGETAFAELLSHFAGRTPLSRVPGITTRELQNPPADPVDLATLPRLYERMFAENPDISWVSFETSRGCPMGCGYCTWGYSRRMRYFPLDYVLAELDVILANPRIREIYLCDSSLLLKKERALTILDHIIDSGSDKQIRYEFSPEQLDDRIIDRMLRLPTNEFNFGIQTINPPALAAIGRPFDRERFESRYRAFIDALPTAQITVDLIYGLPGDDLAGYLRSMDYAMTLPGVSRVLTNPLLVLPGSRFFQRREELGIELAGDGSFMMLANSTFSADEMVAARKYSFLLNLVYLNTALKDALLALAAATGRRPTECMIGFFDALPFELVDGDYPYTIPSVKEDFERRNRVFGSLLARFPELIEAFSAYSDHAFDAILAGHEDAYTEQFHKLRSYAASTPEAEA